MARPAKSIIIQSRHNTQIENNTRLKIETQLKGSSDKLIPPAYLNKNQKKIFKNIVLELEASEILGNLDIYILTQCCISIDRLQGMEKSINDDITLLTSTAYMNSKKKYTEEFFRCCNELSLSPQARAKIGSINLNNKNEQADPVTQLLNKAKG